MSANYPLQYYQVIQYLASQYTFALRDGYADKYFDQLQSDVARELESRRQDFKDEKA